VIELPDEFGPRWYNCGYHGTLHHDVRAVYTKELGMWGRRPALDLMISRFLYEHPVLFSS
jgi:alkyl sulfatase BDS1-like metallo-beta-lactamase superfamily hydrolase